MLKMMSTGQNYSLESSLVDNLSNQGLGLAPGAGEYEEIRCGLAIVSGRKIDAVSERKIMVKK